MDEKYVHSYIHPDIPRSEQLRCTPYFKLGKPELAAAGAAGNGAWTVPNLCTAYNWPNNMPGGGVIAIVELDGGWMQSDMDTFFGSIGQPMPQIIDVSIGGARNNPNQYIGNPSDPDVEVALDIQVAAAAYFVATGQAATIRVYWANANDPGSTAAAIRAATAESCDVFSISWGSDEANWRVWSQTFGRDLIQEMEVAAQKATDNGMIVLAAAGDNDSSDGGPTPANVDVPSSCPHVIACGGTTKTRNDEIVWNNNPGHSDGEGTGGGYSTVFPPQSWQTGAPNGPGRMVPDVAAVADRNTGYMICVHGKQMTIGGTSAVAPLYAGLFASFGKKLGFVTDKLWANQLCFNDITQGDNGFYRAGPGPDPCTGLGSPIGTKLAQIFTPHREVSSMSDCRSNHTFHNWGQTITCKPASYCQPDTENKVSDIVKDALAHNKRVRTVGAGHSWAPLVLTQDVLVNLDNLVTVHTDVPNLKAQAQAGIRLKDLIPRLRNDHMALANTGSITEQSIAGAISTGTHGTGLGLGSISTQIIGMRLVTGTGDFRPITDAPEDADLLNAARLSLGALGILTELTIQCVADYDLEYTAYWCNFDDIVDQMETLAQQNTRVKFWWLIPPIGPKDNVIMTTENPPANPPANTAATNGALPMDTNRLVNNFQHLAGSLPGLNQFLQYTSSYDQVLTIPLLPILHRECEYALPMGKTAEALRAFRRAVEEGDLSLTLPLEVRFVKQDDTLLSPAYHRDVCYIGIATESNANEVIERFEPIMKSFDGRPHWGKCFSLTRQEVQQMYPETYDKFRQIRQELDPKGVFANEFIQQMFM